MIAALLNLLTGGLLKAWEVKIKADGEANSLVADAAIADIKAQIAARESAREIRLATAGFWEMRVATGLVAWPLSLHLALVTLDTMVNAIRLDIPPLPSPMNEWQAAIILSLFGLQGVQGGINAIASAIRGRR